MFGLVKGGEKERGKTERRRERNNKNEESEKTGERGRE